MYLNKEEILQKRFRVEVLESGRSELMSSFQYFLGCVIVGKCTKSLPDLVFLNTGLWRLCSSGPWLKLPWPQGAWPLHERGEGTGGGWWTCGPAGYSDSVSQTGSGGDYLQQCLHWGWRCRENRNQNQKMQFCASACQLKNNQEVSAGAQDCEGRTTALCQVFLELWEQ